LDAVGHGEREGEALHLVAEGGVELGPGGGEVGLRQAGAGPEREGQHPAGGQAAGAGPGLGGGERGRIVGVGDDGEVVGGQRVHGGVQAGRAAGAGVAAVGVTAVGATAVGAAAVGAAAVRGAAVRGAAVRGAPWTALRRALLGGGAGAEQQRGGEGGRSHARIMVGARRCAHRHSVLRPAPSAVHLA
ncbi:MAG: hypothetical protein ACK559_27515, partial [bacterium]